VPIGLATSSRHTSDSCISDCAGPRLASRDVGFNRGLHYNSVVLTSPGAYRAFSDIDKMISVFNENHEMATTR
jgi:hypothetical protein